MNTVIIVTLIICVTIVICMVIRSIDKARGRRDVIRKLQQFDKAFPTFKHTEKRNDNANDDLPKFGDF